MNQHFITRTSALALICAAGPAFADVTPQDVWDDMVKSYGAFGIEVDGQISEEGATLTAEDIVFRVTIPEDYA